MKKKNNNLKNKQFIYKKKNSLNLRNITEKNERKTNKNKQNNYLYKNKNSLNLRNITEKNEKKTNNKNSQNNYLYKNKKLKKGVFLKKPKFNEIMYPFFLNLKLVNEYLKKK